MKTAIPIILLHSFFILLIPLGLHAQEEYYITDSTVHLGSRLVDGGPVSNAKACHVRMGNKLVSYSPYNVREYGFRNGSVYYAHDILIDDSVKRVFLQKLVSGKMSVYFYRNTDIKIYFIEKDSGNLVALPDIKIENSKENFRIALRKFSGDCDKMDGIPDMVTYQAYSIRSYAEAYNTCDNAHFEYPKFGFLAGYVNTRLLIPPAISPEFLRNANLESDGSFTFSLFVDLPLGKNGLCLHPEVQYIRNNFNYFNDGYIDKQKMVINTSCINIPIMAKYYVPVHLGMTKPYFNAGALFSFLLTREAIVLESKRIDEFLVPQKYYKADLMAGQYIGYIAGGGFQFNLFHRINLFTEFRYVRSYSIIRENRLDKGELIFLTGLNI
jgi:hypothetical protein